MVSHVSSRRWLLRDIRPTYVLLVLVAFVVAIFAYSIDWSTARHKGPERPKNVSIEQRYAGSIIVPVGGDLCWTYVLDNRTGSIRDGDYSKCDEATRKFDEKNPSQSMDMLRLREVGKAFRHNGD